MSAFDEGEGVNRLEQRENREMLAGAAEQDAGYDVAGRRSFDLSEADFAGNAPAQEAPDFDPIQRNALPRRASGAVKSHTGLAENRFQRTTPEDGGLLGLWDTFEERGIKDEQVDPYQHEGGIESVRGDTSANATQRDFASGARNFGFQYPLIAGGSPARRASVAAPAKDAPARARGGSFTEGLRDYWKGKYQGESAVEAAGGDRGNRLRALAEDPTFSDVQSYEGRSIVAHRNDTSAGAQRQARPWHKAGWLPWNWNWKKLLPWNWGGGGGGARAAAPRPQARPQRRAARMGGRLDDEAFAAEKQRLEDLLF